MSVDQTGSHHFFGLVRRSVASHDIKFSATLVGAAGVHNMDCPRKKMALITSDSDAMRLHVHQMDLVTSDCVPFRVRSPSRHNCSPHRCLLFDSVCRSKSRGSVPGSSSDPPGSKRSCP